MNDEWIVVGAYLESLVVASGGAAYAYRRLPDGGVELAQKLIAPDIAQSPRFGWSMAMQGDELFIGAPLSTRGHFRQGVVHVYQLRDGRWEPTQELTHAQADGNDSFGDSISVHGDRLVVGTVRDPSPVGGSGGAHVFERRPDGRWVQAASLYASEPTSEYARRVALWGDTLAVSAPNAAGTGGYTGVVDIFDLSCEICPPDFDFDGRLTLFDFTAFYFAFLRADPRADMDGDGDFTIFDFLAFQTAFAEGCE